MSEIQLSPGGVPTKFASVVTIDPDTSFTCSVRLTWRELCTMLKALRCLSDTKRVVFSRSAVAREGLTLLLRFLESLATTDPETFSLLSIATDKEIVSLINHYDLCAAVRSKGIRGLAYKAAIEVLRELEIENPEEMLNTAIELRTERRAMSVEALLDGIEAEAIRNERRFEDA